MKYSSLIYLQVLSFLNELIEVKFINFLHWISIRTKVQSNQVQKNKVCFIRNMNFRPNDRHILHAHNDHLEFRIAREQL